MLAGTRLMPVSNQTPDSVASEYATIAFVIAQVMSSMGTATVVKVVGCTNTGELERPGTVDLKLLIDMVTGDGQVIPHGTVYKAPYMRLQGGDNAVILDPQPGDLGLCVFASRDISAFKGDPDAARDRMPEPGAPPGSRRSFNLSDALYVGGILNGTPTQYVQFKGTGVVVKSPQAITLEAPMINLKGNVAQTDGDVTMSQNLTAEGTIWGKTDVIADNISGKNHAHNNGTLPNGHTGAPLP